FARLRGSVGKLEQLASRMRPASRLRDHPGLSIRPVHRVEPGIRVGLEDPGIAGEMPLGTDARPIGRVEEYGSGRIGAAEGAIVTDKPPPTSSPLSSRSINSPPAPISVRVDGSCFVRACASHLSARAKSNALVWSGLAAASALVCSAAST